MICSPCVPSLAATRMCCRLTTNLRLYMCMSRTWNMDALTSIVYDVPDKRMTRFGEIKHCLPTPVNRIRRVVLFKSG